MRSSRVGMMLMTTVLSGALGGCSALRRPGPVPDLSRDDAIRAEVEARLATVPALSGRTLRVAVRDRAVSLYGLVYGLGELNCAIATAGLAEGVRTVVDQMTMEPGPREVRCASVAPRPGTP